MDDYEKLTGADIRRKYFLPKLTDAGGDNKSHSFTEQKTFTDRRIIPSRYLTHPVEGDVAVFFGLSKFCKMTVSGSEEH